MSRKTTATKAIFVATALGASTLGMSPALAADPTITTVGPVKAPTNATAVITVRGANFSNAITAVTFLNGSTTCTSVAGSVTVVSSTLLYATKPSTGCADGKQTVDFTGPTMAAFAPTDAKKTVTFATPTSITAVSPNSAGGSTFGGTPITITVASATSDSPVKATLGGKPITGLKAGTAANTFVGKTPAGVPGAAALVVTTNGVPTAANSTFVYKQAIKVAPAFVPIAGGAITLTGAGLKPASPATVAVTVCGVAANRVTTKPYTDNQLTVTAPVASTQPGLHATEGGACSVVVTTDVNGSDTDVVADAANGIAAQVNPVSVRTAGSTLTYAAY